MRRAVRYILCWGLLPTLAACTAWAAVEARVGREARVRLVIEGPRLKVRPQPAAGSDVYLRIEALRPVDGGYEYTLIGSALTAGHHQLRDYLEPAEPGVTAAVLPVADRDASGVILAEGLLLEGEDPTLSTPGLRSPLGAVLYHEGMLAAAVAWVLAPILALYIGHRRRARPVVTVAQEGESLEELLRGLAAAVAQPGATTAQKARMERVALSYWRRLKGLAATHPDGVIEQLKRDPEVAAQLRLQERWLHAPDGAQRSAQDAVARYLELRGEDA